MWFSYKIYKSHVPSKVKMYFVVDDEIGCFISEDYNISTKMVYLDHRSGDKVNSSFEKSLFKQIVTGDKVLP